MSDGIDLQAFELQSASNGMVRSGAEHFVGTEKARDYEVRLERKEANLQTTVQAAP
jgi:hypothetical protein